MVVYNTSDDLFGVTSYIVDATAGQGNYQTIGAALTAASTNSFTGDIFIRPGTYTENPALIAGVNLVGFVGDGNTPTVTISGKCTFSSAGTVSISGIRLQTNSDNFLAVTGSVASIVNLDNCYLNCTNATGISYTSSSASSQVNITNCRGNLGTTGIGFHSSSGAGQILFYGCNFTNSGASTTGDSASAGTVAYKFTQISHPVTTSSTANLSIEYAKISTATNTTTLTVNGSGSSAATICHFASGSAAAISIGASATLTLGGGIVINSTNSTAVITGTGALNSSLISFIASGTIISKALTLSSVGSIQGLVTTSPGAAPSAGFLGERMSSAVTSVSISSATPTNITSISLTPGVWDITASAQFSSSAFTGNTVILGISTTSATFAGNFGDQKTNYNSNAAASLISIGLSVPAFRAVVTATTTYFMVGQITFTGGTGSVDGRLSAVRVG